MKWLRELVIRLCKRGEPSIVVSAGYLNRWYVIPRNKYFNIYFHEFIGSDDDRAEHDHPWDSISWVLRGTYIEHVTYDWDTAKTDSLYSVWHGITTGMAGDIIRRPAEHMHRIELINDEPVYTLFCTWRKRRSWGFLCPKKGWIHWEQFCKELPDGTTRGCD